MKYYLLFFACLFLTKSSFAMEGKSLPLAVESAFIEASMELNLEDLAGWEVSKLDDEAEVKFLINGNIITFGCHLHGDEMACHEEGHEHDKSLSEDYLLKANKAALSKFEKSMKRKGEDLNVITSYKVWFTEDNDHGHEADVWTKFSYKLNNMNKNIFVLCHTHGDEDQFSCHYKKDGENEPSFE
jgi:hypothetical protein